MNLYASYLTLNIRAIKDFKITDPYSIHRVVYSLYERTRDEQSKKASEASGILYTDIGGNYRERRIIMLANRRPAHELEEIYGKLLTREVPASFFSHSHYRFSVAINPTRRSSSTTKLIPIKGKDVIAEWFAERANKSWGFEVQNDSLQIGGVEVLRFLAKEGRAVTIVRAQINGFLRVLDKKQFENSFSKGIGRARTFGCGMLQIIPIK